jgi:hypothetical protein
MARPDNVKMRNDMPLPPREIALARKKNSRLSSSLNMQAGAEILRCVYKKGNVDEKKYFVCMSLLWIEHSTFRFSNRSLASV